MLELNTEMHRILKTILRYNIATVHTMNLLSPNDSVSVTKSIPSNCLTTCLTRVGCRREHSLADNQATQPRSQSRTLPRLVLYNVNALHRQGKTSVQKASTNVLQWLTVIFTGHIFIHELREHNKKTVHIIT